MESLKGKTVGIIKDYGYGDDFMNNPDFKRDPVPDFVTNVKKLVAESIDLTLEDEIVGRVPRDGGSRVLDQIEFTQNALSGKVCTSRAA
jgi:polar amino acid transport system substrate-binding protein